MSVVHGAMQVMCAVDVLRFKQRSVRCDLPRPRGLGQDVGRVGAAHADLPPLLREARDGLGATEKDIRAVVPTAFLGNSARYPFRGSSQIS